MKAFIVTVVLGMVPSLAYAQAQEPSVCDIAEDPYRCECPLELNEKVGSCQMIQIEALPDFLEPVDTSAWMSTTWDEVRQSWRVSIDLSQSPTGRCSSR